LSTLSSLAYESEDHCGFLNTQTDRHYPAVLLFATLPAVEDSCGGEAALADNFLQKQQKTAGSIIGAC